MKDNAKLEWANIPSCIPSVAELEKIMSTIFFLRSTSPDEKVGEQFI